MKIGFFCLYSWRPHVEHMHYLASLLEREGHEIHFLTCDSDLPSCYTREMRPHSPALVECAKCMMGGIRSFRGHNVTSLGALAGPSEPAALPAREWVVSSASTLGRFESDEDYHRPEFARYVDALEPAARKAYGAVRAWIAAHGLQGLYLFNGRMDALRAAMEAAKDAGIPFASVERTWFGDGLQILPNENCIGLKAIGEMVGAWSARPLSRIQALRATAPIAARHLRQNNNEWRAYNTQAADKAWPIEKADHRILLLPGSRNEVWGHPDWQDRWSDRLAAFDVLIEHFNFRPQDIVLRCHPNWGELINGVSGAMAEDYYTAWAKKRGILCIPSRDTTSTLGLISQCDAIGTAGGSAALEAGALGKQVFAFSPSWYDKAGFQTTLYGTDDMQNAVLLKTVPDEARQATMRDIQRKSLRFCYTMGYRVAQFVPFVRCITTTQYKYYEGADAARLEHLLRDGRLEADDAAYAQDETEEDAVLDLLGAGQWERLPAPEADSGLKSLAVSRRFPFGVVDWLRSKFKRGDL